MKPMIKKNILKIINEFNKYRKPEIVGKLISINKDILKIRFTGSFCHTCGFYDYFEDFKFHLDDNKLKNKIFKIKETKNGAIVEFKLN